MSRKSSLFLPPEGAPFVLRLEGKVPPLDWREVFGRTGPVELEIGSGKGLFLSAASEQRPDSLFLGLERAEKWFLRSVGRFLKEPRPNVRLLRCDAFDFLHRWVPPGSLAAVHIYFPDPWPKKRHAKRRLLQGSLIRLIERSLAEGAVLQMASDVEAYFQEAVEILGSFAAFRRVPWPEDARDRLPTSYAVKYERAGRTLRYARFTRLALEAAGTAEDPAGNISAARP